MTEQTTDQPGVSAAAVLAGYRRALTDMTDRAITAEAMVATLLAEKQATPAEPEQAD